MLVTEQAPPTNFGDEDDSLYTLLVLNDSGDFNFNLMVQNVAQAIQAMQRNQISFFLNFMFKSVQWRIVVEERNWNIKRCNISNWKDVTTAEMKGFLSAMFNMGWIKRNALNDYQLWKNVQLFKIFTTFMLNSYYR